MGSNYKKLGGYIRPVDERNRDLAITNLQGVSIAKEFVPSIANIIGTDLSTYKIVRTGQFAYGPVTSRNGDKVSIALLKGEDCIISSSYVPFEVYKPDELLPEYLMLWFMRPEFDRYARFMSNGSAREVFDWDSMCGVELPVPSLPEQRKIVHDYQVITDRIELLRKMNENLEQQAQIVFHSLFIDVDETNCTLADICNINPSRTLKKGEQAMCFEMATLPVSGSMPVGGEVKPYNGGTRFKNGDTLIARITPCFENGKAAYINMLNDNEVAFGSTEYIVFSSKGNIPSSFYYYLVRNKKFKDFGMQFMNGSSGRQRISGEEFGSFAMKKPSSADIERFAPIGEQTLMTIKRYSQEIALLLQVQSNIVSGIASLSKGA